MWEYLGKVQIPKPKQVRIGSKTIDCVFIRYAVNSSAYWFLVKKSELLGVHEGTTIELSNIVFFEDIFHCKEKEIGSLKLTYDGANKDDDNLQVDEEPRWSKKQGICKIFDPKFITYLLENDPKTFDKTISSPKAPFWKEAVHNEIESIINNHTCELVDRPPENKALGCKWNFKRNWNQMD